MRSEDAEVGGPVAPDANKLRALGLAIRAKRKAQSLTLEEVSAKAGKSVATLSRIEMGRQAIDVGTLLVLGEALGFSAGALLIEVQAQESASSVEQAMWAKLQKLLS